MSFVNYKIHHFEKLDSTNDYALINRDNLSFGDVIVATTQTNGHGRFDRKWVSMNNKNVYMTIVLGNISKFSLIVLYTAVVVARVLDKLGVNAQIKWPNDILVNDKKISGILIQNQVRRSNNFVVVGLGVNLDLTEEDNKKLDRHAISLKDCNVNIDKESFINMVIDTFFTDLAAFMNTGFSGIKKYYEIKSSLIGKQITVKCSQKEITGVVSGFSDKGELMVLVNNELLKINSGEVVRIL